MKKLLIVFMLLAMVFTFGACKKKETTESTSEQSGKEAASSSKKKQAEVKNVTIKLGMWKSSPAEEKLVDDQIALLEKKYPEIKVEKEVASGDFIEWIKTAIAAQNDPDTWYLDVNQADAFIGNGWCEPMDEYIDKYNVDMNDFEAPLLEKFKKDGKLYGIPKDYNTLAVFYNKDALTEAGVQPPTNWAEFKAAAKAVTDKGAMKGACLSYDHARFGPFFFMTGGGIVDDAGMPVLESDANVKAVEYYGSMFKEGIADTPQNLEVGWNGEALATKKAAMVLEGGWMIPYMKESGPDVNYGISEMPAYDDGKKSTFLFTVAYVVSSNSKEKDAAFKVADFLTNHDSLQLVVNSGLAIPTRTTDAKDYIKKYPERQPIVDGASYAVPYNYGKYSDKIGVPLSRAMESFATGAVGSAKDALKTAQEEIMKEIEGE